MSLPAQRRSLKFSLTFALLLAGGSVSTAESEDDGLSHVSGTSSSTRRSQTSGEVYEDENTFKRLCAYCTRSWQNGGVDRQDWDDCTHDVLVRLLGQFDEDSMHSAVSNPESTERRELNRAVWAIAQRWRRRPSSAEFIEAPSRNTGHDSWVAHEEVMRSVRQAITTDAARLSPIQREIMTRWSEGESVASISQQMRIEPARVSDEKYKAIRKLKNFFAENGENSASHSRA